MADRKALDTFANPHPQRDYLIEHQVREFTSLCPVTGQPDFGTIVISADSHATSAAVRASLSACRFRGSQLTS